MKNDKILKAMGGIDDELVSRAAVPIKNKNEKRVMFAPWRSGSPRSLLRGVAIWAMPMAACLVLAIGLFSVRGVLFPPSGGTGGGAVAGGYCTRKRHGQTAA